MEAWWEGLSALNKVFALSALVFSILFIWQMIAALLGADTDSHMHTGDAGVDHSLDTHDHVHGSDAVVAFTLISVRSLIAFGTLFSWSGTLYLSAGTLPCSPYCTAVSGEFCNDIGLVSPVHATPAPGERQYGFLDCSRNGSHRVS